ncbi:MAG: response regulator [Thermodesulfovibrionales bacterium]|nr:response regulator [Thermodesulfovibrionales bacterium]
MSKVIIIDDEPFILMMVEDKLKRAGIKVVTLRESVNAVDVIRKESPDLIILDWMMPEVSGIEVCRRLKADPDLAAIPIFMLTAKGQEEDEKQGLICGVERYITKPFSPKVLLDHVLETLGRQGSR